MIFNYIKIAIIAILSVASPIVSQLSQPSMIYMLNRHGASPCIDPPPKETGAQLFDSSYNRNYIKGQRIRQIYPNLLSNTYKYNEIHVNSTAWQRTVATGNSVLHGLYPYLNNDTSRIAVFTNTWEFDYTLYNYDKCPNWDKDWATFKTTPEWLNAVQKYSNLTFYLTSFLNPSKPYTLDGIYSIWEVHNTQRRYPETGIRSTSIDDYTFQVLTEAATYVETRKYGTDMSKDYFGNTFLSAVKFRMQMHISKDVTFGKKVAMSFAHYPNILFTLSSLGYTGPISKLIPGYNSALVFELYNETLNTVNYPSGWGIKIRYYEGNKQWASHTSIADGYPIALGNCVEGVECKIDYSLFWSMYKPKTLADWCTTCGSGLWMCVGATSSSSSNSNISILSSDNEYQSIQIATLSVACVILFIILVSFIRSFFVINPTSVVSCGKPTHEAIPMNVV